jgi:hypothetical protein
MPIECCDVKKKREKDQEQLRTEMTSSLDGRNGTRGRVLENLTLCLFSNSQPPGIGMRRAELLMTVLLRSEVSVRRELYYFVFTTLQRQTTTKTDRATTSSTATQLLEASSTTRAKHLQGTCD